MVSGQFRFGGKRLCESGICKVGDEDLARGVSTRYATVTTTTLFVRTEPGTEASVLFTMLPEGEDVVVYDALDEYGWYRVSTEEGLGYVSGDYVTVRTEFRVAESKEEEKERLEREEAERQAAAAAAEAARKAREEEERGSGSSEKDTGRSGKSNGTAADTKCATGATKK